MNTLNKELNIPGFLQELHGQRARVIDLLLTYLTGVLVCITVLYYAREMGGWKQVVLGFLTLDLAGGIVANFTEGTNLYYKNRAGKRYFFIALHVLQPLLIYYVFSVADNFIPLMAITAYTLVAMLLINGLTDYLNQRVYAAFFLVLGLSVVFCLNYSHPIVTLLVLLYMIKLLLAFAVKWN
ncbi:hypothetical protein D770_12150 [Flammeovirgaceae bacterium 311]|nr:hypothetical protein D770_12150 [Flammeovirgaceae bacterium 311]